MKYCPICRKAVDITSLDCPRGVEIYVTSLVPCGGAIMRFEHWEFEGRPAEGFPCKIICDETLEVDIYD